jgi:hypothetical protein
MIQAMYNPVVQRTNGLHFTTLGRTIALEMSQSDSDARNFAQEISMNQTRLSAYPCEIESFHELHEGSSFDSDAFGFIVILATWPSAS